MLISTLLLFNISILASPAVNFCVSIIVLNLPLYASILSEYICGLFSSFPIWEFSFIGKRELNLPFSKSMVFDIILDALMLSISAVCVYKLSLIFSLITFNILVVISSVWMLFPIIFTLLSYYNVKSLDVRMKEIDPNIK